MPTLTRNQVLDEVHYLATVEHALCVDYLIFYFALGADLDPAVTVPEGVREMAEDEMRHLRRVNKVLILADRPTTLERAGHVLSETGAPLALAAFRREDFDGFPARHRAVTAAVDRRWAQLKAALDASPTLFEEGDELHGALMFAISSASDHTTPMETLAAQLTGDFLRATETTPTTGYQRDLMAVCDGYYRTIVAALATSFAHEGQFGGPVLTAAVATMDRLREVGVLLVKEGLVPRFSLSG